MGWHRLCRWGMLPVVGFGGSVVPTTSVAEMTAKDRAYTLTLTCAAFASEYGTEADALRTIDAIRKMGRAQGYSLKRVSKDAMTATSVVAVEIREDSTKIERYRNICRKLKLMD